MKEEKIKLLWCSDSISLPTGYGRVTKEVLTRLNKDKFDVNHFGKHTFGQPHTIFGVMTYPAGSRHDGSDIFPFHMQVVKPDIVVWLQDMWMYDFILNMDLSPSKLVLYFPLDGVPVPVGCHRHLLKADLAVAMSQFGRKTAEDFEFFEPAENKYVKLMDRMTRKIDYIPHGVNTNIFKPLKKQEIEELRKGEQMENSFVIGMVSRNQPRKNLPSMFKVFKQFLEKHPDALLYLHSDAHDPQGYDLLDLEYQLKLRGKVRYTKIQSYKYGVGDDVLNKAYNIMDIHTIPTCYLPNSKIVTEKGLKKIREIKIGERVLTHKGRFNKVIKKITHAKRKRNCLRITPYYGEPIELTENHRVFAIKRNVLGNKGQKIKAKKEKLSVCQANELKRGFVLAFPRIKKTHKKMVDKSLMFLYGVYLAEGCIIQRHHGKKVEGIAFCFNQKKVDNKIRNKTIDIMKKNFGLLPKIFNYSRNRQVIKFYSANLGRKFKKMFGSGTKNKKFPEEFLFYNPEEQKELIKGVWLGDGCFHIEKRNNTAEFDYTTTSTQLNNQLRLLLIRLGFLPSIYFNKKRHSFRIRIQGNQVNEFNKLFNKKLPKRVKNLQIGWVDKDFVYFPIRKIERFSFSGQVFDLTVKEDHSYANNGFIAKNTGEGFGLTILEAMSAGIPQSITDYTTTEELLGTNNERGIRVPPCQLIGGSKNVDRAIIDHKKYLESWEYLYDNPSERKKMSKAARKEALKYDWSKKIVPMWEKRFEELMYG